MEFNVVRILPSEAMKEVHKPDSKLVRLVLSGYDLTDKEKEDPIVAASADYDFPDDRAKVFIAKRDEEIVGSVTFVLWPNELSDKRGGRFWPKLKELDELLAKRAMAINPLACDVGGVVVLPELRGQRIGQLLLENAVKQVNPSIVVGNTKTVEAVALRRKLVNLGYRTFYANTEVTPGHEQEKTNDHEAILKAYLFAKEYEDVLPEGNVFIYHGGIAPTIPNTNGFADIIQEAFKPLISTQSRLGNKNTVMGPLIAVRKEILATE
ncbi:MAG TPA: GNAT family N-acetyltransferase [Patescibacteria group bacterium]